jgi:putative acetyltransferase
MALSLFLVAASGIVVRDRTVLFLRRSQQVDHAPGEWDIVNGRLDSGETVLAALQRELVEETGLDVEILGPLDTWRALRGKEQREMIGVVHLCRWRAGEVRLSEEHDDFRWVPFEAIPSFPIHESFRPALLLVAQRDFHAAPQHGTLPAMSTKTADLSIAQEPPRQPEVLELLRQSDAYSAERYPPESSHMLGLDALEGAAVRFFVARRGGKAVGCGALVVGPGGQGEIKRMFVGAAGRGGGIGKAVLQAIEDQARREGLTLLQLETGTRNLEALSLYRRFGYRHRGPFGNYPTDDPLSVFMEKELG